MSVVFQVFFMSLIFGFGGLIYFGWASRSSSKKYKNIDLNNHVSDRREVR
jgi:hypothetical protein